MKNKPTKCHLVTVPKFDDAGNKVSTNYYNFRLGEWQSEETGQCYTFDEAEALKVAYMVRDFVDRVIILDYTVNYFGLLSIRKPNE